MKESKHHLQSTRYRSPYQSTHRTAYNPNPQIQIPRWKEVQSSSNEFYSANQLQNILSQQRLTNNQRSYDQTPTQLTCVCPKGDQLQNNIHIYAINQRNQYLQKKIESMKHIFMKQQDRLSKLVQYSKTHMNCQNNCYKDKYFELLKNIQPK